MFSLLPSAGFPPHFPSLFTGQAVDAAFGLGWLFHLLACQAFVPAVEALGLASVCTLFGLVAVFGAWYVRAQVPETRGKPVAVIEQEVQSK